MSIVVVREPSGRVQVRAGGPRGPQGVAGPEGDPGPAGPEGDVGAAGAAGAAGAQGDAGPPGDAGPAGADGQDGAQGPQGVPGVAGPPGDDGAPGAPGADGAPGAQGPAGDDGAQGPQGIQGVPGTDGADGAEGPEGPQPPLSNADPLALADVADDGAAAAASKADHVHPRTGLATDVEAAQLADDAQAQAEQTASDELDGEELTRAAADEALQDAIDAEEAARIAADTAEAATRDAADDALVAALAQELADRAAGDLAVRADLANRRWAGAAAFSVILGAAMGTVGGDHRVLLFDKDVDETAQTTVEIPPWWVTFRVVIWWLATVAPGAGADTVRWSMRADFVADGGTPAAGALGSIINQVAPGINVIETLVQPVGGSIANVAGGGVLNIVVNRKATHANDNLAGDAGLYGVMVERLT